MPKMFDATGLRFNRLVGVRRLANRGSATIWLFTCDCGQEVETHIASVKRGVTRSCGCFQQEVRSSSHTTHGGTTNRQWAPEYGCWVAAKGRATKPSNHAYKDYGGRGIGMSPEWAADFGAFLADMGPRPPGTSLDRIDNDRGYERGNCRWATRLEQARNKRSNVVVLVGGERLILKQYASLNDVSYSMLSAVMKERNMTAEAAVALLKARRAA